MFIWERFGMTCPGLVIVQENWFSHRNHELDEYTLLNTSVPSVKVSYGRDPSNKRCGTIPSGGWEVKDFSGDSIMVKFKSDAQSNKKGFEAVYTFVSLDGCKY